MEQDQEFINQCIEHYKGLCPELHPEVADYLSHRMTVHRLDSKSYYVKSGTVQKGLNYLTNGLIRAFYVNQDGDETTAWFCYENEYVIDYPNFISRQPSQYHFQCLEPCVIVSLPYEDIQEGYRKYPMLERYGRLVTEQVLVALQSRVDGFLFLSAAERYLRFIEKNPALFQRISLTDLATYLGVERQSLSRIRKQLSQK